MQTEFQDIYELTPLQEAMLAQSLYAPESAIYNMPFDCELHGELDAEAFEAAWRKLIDRHDVLRTSFVWEDLERPYQVVHRSVEFAITRHDWRDLTTDERDARVDAHAEEERAQVFSLTEAPVLRASLVRVGDDVHRLILTAHHAVLEAWSLRILVREAGAIYENLVCGTEPALPPARRFVEYIRWLRERDEAATEAYWRETLRGLAAPARLPADHSGVNLRAVAQTNENWDVTLPRALSDGLRDWARTQRLTQNTVFQGLWALLLSRYTGSADVVFGIAVNGRPADLPGAEDIVGMFVNTIPVRVAVHDTDRLVPWLQSLQRQQAAARQYEFAALRQVQAWSGMPGGQPLFDNLFVFQNWAGGPVTSAWASGVSIHPSGSVGRSDQPLTLHVAPDQETRVVLQSNPNLFDGATVERILGHYRTLLEGLVAGADRPLSSLSMLSETERRRLLIEWNDTAVDLDTDRCLHELFRAQVQRSPDATALVAGETQLTFRELDRKSNWLAHRLRALGADTDVPIAICTERTPDMVVGILGILKAGGAYVPLDPSYPAQRLRYILDDVRAPLLLTSRHLAGELPVDDAHVVYLDADWPDVEGGAKVEVPPTSRSAPGNIAYVIYTSGSTGHPKGVAMTHANAASLLLWAEGVFDEDDRRGLLASTSICFDLSVFQLFLPLCFGGTVILAENALALPTLPSRGEVTLVNTVPSAISELLRQEAVPATVRTVCLAGEPLIPEIVDRLYDVGVKRVFDLYGPSEDTTYSTFALRERGGPATIGRPIANGQIYILDRSQRPVPIGVTGELYLGGSGVARGYFDRPGPTAERFVPDPFSGKPGKRLYRTGDLGRYRPDGNIEFLGRIDHQVKLRGFRIELGEVEAVLGQFEQVREAVVLCRSDAPAQKRLVAYVVPDGDAEPSRRELRSHLTSKLPEYMVPSAFVFLDALPLTPNGKVNRAALPAPGQERQAEDVYVAPRTAAEISLAAIWADLLRVDRVGVNDNFFELGGDSILGIQVIGRAREAGLHLAARQIFQHHTVGALAAVAETETSGSSVMAEQEPVVGELPLTPIEHWFFEQELTDSHHFNQSMLVSVRERLAGSVVERAVEALLAHHDALRLRFERSEAGWKQVNAESGGPVPFECVDLSALAEAEQSAAITTKAETLQASLDLSEGPLVRVALFDLGEDRPGRLLIVIHHLAVDGVSWRILLEDLQRACEQVIRGEEVGLPAKTTSYRQWSDRLAAHADSEEMLAELEWWADQPWEEAGSLPVAGSVEQNTAGLSRSQTIELSEEETRSLLQEVPRAYNTQIDDVLLTALVQAFAPWTGRGSLLVNLEGHGREALFEDVDLSRTVGWFTAIYPVILDGGGSEGMPLRGGAALKSIKEQLRGVPNRGIGYGLLRYLGGDATITAELAALPHPEVSFNYLGQFDQMVDERSMFGQAGESKGAGHSPDSLRAHLIDVVGAVTGGRLLMKFAWGSALHEAGEIAELAERYRAALVGLIAHCTAPESGGSTPSDFPLATVNQRTLDELVAEYGPREIEDLYPLSPMQLGMMFHSASEPTSGVYVQQMRFGVDGLDVETFKRSWETIVARHSVLRTSIVGIGSETPLQLVHRHVELPVTEHDLRELTEDEQKAWLETFEGEDRVRGFDLADSPLMRLSIVRCGEEQHEFMWTFHHVLLDGWSVPRVINEVFAVYGARRRNEDAALPRLHPYREYIAWLQRQDLDDVDAYWRRTLAGFTEPTVLGIDRGPGGRSEGVRDYDVVSHALPAELSSSLRQVAARHRVTLNGLLTGVWSILLGRYSGQEDVLFGTVVSGRPAEIDGVASMVGLFINTQPTRVQVQPEASVGGWLGWLQDALVQQREYEHGPLWRAHQQSELSADTRLFESLFVFENYPSSRVDPAGSTLDVKHHPSVERTGYPLTMVVIPRSAMIVRLIFDRDRFDRSAIERVVKHYVALLEGLIAGGDRRLGEIPLLDETERRQLLVAWNDTATAYPDDQCIHELFEEQAAGTPEAVALEFEGEQLTYDELNRRANQVAHHLIGLGVGPEVKVGIAAERSVEMAVGILGVLKAGGAYVPLDPGYPPARLAFMMQDTRAPVVLTQAHLKSKLPDHDGTVLRLDADWPVFAAEPDTNPVAATSATSLAYVMYTSGSTGRPKGVCVTHRSVIRLVRNTNYLTVDPDDVFLQFAPISFDASTLELWGSLLNGAKLVVFPPQTPSLEELGQALETHGITTLWLTGALFQQMVNEQPDRLVGVRQLLAGGDVLSAPHVRRMIERLEDEHRLINGYGPTENTTFTCCHVMGPESSFGRSVPIGRPIGNTTAYILDASRQPVPVGVPGELYTGGDGLARGYLNDPGLTAERFVPDPFVGEPGARLYRTGDLARYRPDGMIEFLGRADHQVKVRGYRIELGEIETALRSHDDVQDAVAVVCEDGSGEKQLVAYVVAGPSREPVPWILREHVTEKLPKYMVPSTFVFLEAIPLTPNGKVDRGALPSPGRERQAELAYVAPRSELEARIAEIWREVLKLDTVGVHDNFFDLGGHSLLATQVVSRFRRVFATEIPLPALFRKPTIAGLSEILRAEGPGEATTSEIIKRPRDGELPLSFAQQRFWFLDQIGAGAAYNIVWALRLEGRLDLKSLENSVNAIVERHEGLRTCFPSESGKAVQDILPSLHVPLCLVDLRELDEVARQRKVEDLQQQEMTTPFDLARGPLVRTTVAREGDSGHVLLLTFHHIVFDGWSMGVFTRELIASYRAFTTSEANLLPDLPVQYADFSHWQREWMQGDALERHLAYWREELANLPVLQLPTDHARPAVQTFIGALRSIHLTPELTSSLRALNRDHGVTMAMTMLTVFQVLLSRYSGQDDVVVGLPIANRNRHEIESLIGCFVNTLALRTDLSGDPAFSELIRRVKRTMLAAYEHQDVPFEYLVDVLEPDRDLSQNPIFQVMFSMQNMPREDLALAGLSISPLRLAGTNAHFDLELYVLEASGGLTCSFVYNTDLFNDTTIERMGGHYQRLLENIVAGGNRSIDELSMLDETERHRLLVEWNDTAVAYPQDQCLPELLERQVELTPDTLALQFETEQLTYGELNARVNQLAHLLRARGVGPNVLVGLSLERSVEMVVGILGIVKAGGAYVPIDPTYPEERIAFMMEDAATSVLVTVQSVLERLPDGAASVVCLDRDQAELQGQSAENPDPIVRLDDLAYMIYTSGSTGRPKGAMITHRAIVNRLRWMQDEYSLTADDRVLQKTPFSFDVSVWEFFWPLITGARLVVARPEGHRDPACLARTITECEVTTLHFVPSMLRAFLEAPHVDSVGCLKRVICSGEALLPDLRDAFVDRIDAELHNLYGPTEAAVDVTAYRCDDAEGSASVPIGRPIANTTAYVLDAAMRAVPVDVGGELFIGGVQLARGYFGQPGLTAERFVPDPFGGSGGRLYRTGDQVRYRADGNIEFLGRIDHQVKLHGFRIELGEIEAVLGLHAQVRDVAVLCRSDTPGGQRLVAYVVSDGDAEASVRELREHVSGKLPEYMVPSAFVFLEVLPLTPNGKVNRAALPAPGREREEVYVAPRTPAEQVLAGIWSELLRVDRVGVNDNFFGLGGDSILSIQVISRAREAGLHLAARQMFQHQTVGELAAVAETEGSSPSVLAEQEAVVGEVPLTPIGHWFFEQELADAHHFNQSMLMSVRERLAGSVVEQAVEGLLAHHDALRLRFERSEAGWQQVNAEPGGAVPFECVDLSSLAEDEQSSAITAKAESLQASLDLEEGPLLRVALIDLGGDRPARLLIVIHHLAVDGVSWRILREDLQRACEQVSRGEAIDLPAKTTAFKQWSQRLAAHADSEEVRSELERWLDQPWEKAKPLPVSGNVERNTAGLSQRQTIALSEEETRALLQEVPRAYNTQIEDVLLTALVHAFAPWTGGKSLLVDLEGHGREALFDDVDLSRTVGWFTAIYPVLLDGGGLDGPSLSTGAALKSIKEQLRSVPNRGLGYGLLRYLSGDAAIAEKLGALPAAEVSFNYLGQFDQMVDERSMFGGARESLGAMHSPCGLRHYLLDVLGAVTGGRLQMSFIWGSELHEAHEIEELAERYRAALVGLIAHCTARESGGCTPSDFPLATVDQRMLDELVAEYGPRAIENVYPLSPMQQGMMFHSAYEPTSGVYVQQMRFAVDGLDAKTFKRSWEEVIARHAVLRTSLAGVGTEAPLQVVHRHVELPVTEHDLREMTEEEQEAWVERFMGKDQGLGFDLDDPPLMRLALIRLGEQRYEFVWTFHHIALDGWSFPRVINDVFAVYGARCRNEDVALPRLRPYRDYIAWLREQDAEEARSFWQRTLEGFTTPTRIGEALGTVDAIRTTERYDQKTHSLSADLTASLQRFASRHRVTMNTLIAGAWSLLLSRYSGEPDVVFGMIASGRPADLDGVESMVGMFMNTLPLRARVPDGEKLVEWLRDLQAHQAELRQYEYSPLWQVQQEAELPAGTPLFDSLYVFENYPVDASAVEQSDLKIRFKPPVERTGYPLTLTVDGTSSLLGMRITYDPDRLDAPWVRSILDGLVTALAAFAADPEQRVGRISLLSESARHCVLDEWNDTAAPYARDACIHELFERQAVRTPKAIAVEFGGQQLTYDELNRRANQIAHHLIGCGVGPEVKVGIAVERSFEMVVGILGVLKAGGAYVPLDPSYPPARLGFMMWDTRAPVVLTQAHLESNLPEHDGTVLRLDADWPQFAGEPQTNPRPNPSSAASATSLAYVMYTSGSTGRPKGVCVTHGGLCNYLLWSSDAYGLEPGRVALVHSSIAFDLTVTSLLAPLVAGATVSLLPEAPGVESLVSAVRDAPIVDLVKITPAHVELLSRALSADERARIGTLVIGGENLTAEHVALWEGAGVQTTLVNEYGPTETVVGVSTYHVPRSGLRSGSVPIGRPIANAQLYVLDRHLEPVPVSVPGELYIGGAGVARGYLNDPALTAERFMPDPYGGKAGARLYCTGDRARYTADGTLEFLGRVDLQMKVRGFRIEPGEIETALLDADGVREAVVVARADGSGEKQLVAYVVAGPSREPVPWILREHVTEKLPKYMVPSTFVFLEAIPLTPNGKVDRGALPSPGRERQAELAYVAPRSELEARIAEIWREVLKLDTVGVHDNFFDLGGHSLLATQVVSRFRRVFATEIPLPALFRKPTIAGLSEILRAEGPGEATTSEIIKRPRDGELPLSFAQQRFWFLDQIGAGAAYNIVWALRLEGRLDLKSLENSVNAIVERHEGLRTCFPSESGKAVQDILPSLHVPLCLVDLRELDEVARQRKVEDLQQQEMTTPFDLARGPLVRTTVAREGDSGHVLLLTFHHIVFDGWSMGVFTRELIASYRAFTTSEANLLPDLPVQYADFSHWQREWMQGDALERHLAYWREELANLPVLQLPTDHARPAVQTFIGALRSIHLTPELTSSLRALNRDHGVTMAMTMLTVFQVLLSRYSGQDDVVVGLPIANRNRHEIESLIGCFVNTLALRTDLSGDPAFSELIRRVKRTMLAAYEHQDVPFEYLVDVLEPDRDLSQNPIFQVMFSMQNMPREDLALAGLTISPLRLAGTNAHFDLELYVLEASGGLTCSFVYNTDLFNDATIERMGGHYQRLLENIVAGGNRSIDELSMLDETERHRLLVEWNDTAVDLEGDRCLHELFRAQVRRSPDATAVVAGETRLTFRELDRKSNVLAHALRAGGADTEVPIAICTERTADMVVGILGILKAGGAYVALDPSYPAERLRYILEDIRAPLVLASRHLAAELPLGDADVVCVDADWPEVEGGAEAPPVSRVAASNLAYIIYTSGSTGHPKGVAMTHGNAASLVLWAQRVFDEDDRRGLLASTSICFDLSVFELFLPLCCGGTVILAENALALPTLPSRDEVTLVNTVPSAITELLRQEAVPGTVRTVCLAGEPLTPAIVDRLYDGGVERVFDLYGPSEDTTYSTFALRERGGPATIGRPIANERVYILNRSLRPMPIGATGELYIGGTGVARGYFDRPGLTAERFVPDPFVGEPGARLYRTGDLARYRPDGMIEFLGRADHQVKLRGYRIELGEIETALRSHDEVQDAVAMVREDEPGEKRLVAYMVSELNREPVPRVLREHVTEKLPTYMVPSTFVFLEAIPRTSNGKVDRSALPAPGHEHEAGEVYVAPRTPEERVLAGIWSELLRVDRVGVNDNFFGLGGDSILSIQVIARARESGLYLTPRQMFQHQTVGELAAVAETERSGRSVMAEQGPVVGEVPLTPIGHWFFEQELADAHHFNQSMLMSVRERLAGSVVEQAVEGLLAHHDALRLRFERSEAGWQQVNAEPGGAVPFECVDLSSLAEDEQSSAITAKAESLQASLDLEEGPLLRVALIDLGGDRPARLLIVIHHLAVDGVSWRILREDLQRACEQVSRGEAIDLPAKTTAFKQWSQRLAAHADSEEVRSELERWLDQPWEKAKPLPVSGNVERNTAGLSQRQTIALSEEETRALLQEVPRAYNTQIEDVLLTALVHAFAPWTGGKSLLVDLEGHGREALFDDVDLSRTVGWFTAIYPVLLDGGGLDGPSLSTGAALKSIKEQLRSVPNRGLGYGLLRYLSGDAAIAEKLGALPAAEVSFNYLGQFDQMVDERSMFGGARESLGAMHSPCGLRHYLLDVLGAVTGGRLQMSFIWGSELHEAHEIEELAERYRAALVGLIAHCTARESGGCTPSDFPLATVDQRMLDELVAEYGPRAIENVYPLSPMQQGMMFHSAYEPTSGVYVVQMRFAVDGLDAETFKRSWEEVIARHAVLRTSLAGVGTEAPLQVVHRHVELPVTEHDLREMTEEEQEAWVERFMGKDQGLGFDLDDPPLMRLALIRLGEQRYEFVWTFHHIALDGWSFPRVINDVFAVYGARCRNEDVALPRLRPYRDYIAWLKEQDAEEARSFWQRTLEGFTTPTRIGEVLGTVDAIRTTERYDQETHSLSADLTASLQRFASRHRVTMNTLIAGAWSLLLSRYSGEPDVVFGMTASGRPADLDGVESMVGMFMNTLPLRARVPDGEKLVEWLRDLQAHQAELRQYEYSPLWQVQQEAELPAGTPLFDSLYVFENYPVDASAVEQSDLKIRHKPGLERTGYPLMLSASLTSLLQLQLTYDRDRFEAQTIRRAIDHLQTLLEGMADAPETRLGTVPMLDETERHRLLVEWNDTAVGLDGDRCLHELLERQAEHTPDAVAVQFEMEQLTYGELNARANQLAHLLRARGVGPDVLVGLSLERCVEMVVGILGIVKAGGAYVPIDPTHPEERIALMMEDASTSVLVTVQSILERLPDGTAHIICLDRDQAELERQSTENPDPGVKPDNLAYMIYTSGSTGRPKGAMITHRAIVNRLLWMQDEYRLTADDRVLQKTSFSFDVSVWEFFWPLITGAQLVVARPDGHRDPAYLARTIAERDVTTLHFVPSMLRAFLEAPPLESVGCLKRVICSGEALLPDLRDAFVRRIDAELHNLYGPTEAAVDVTAYRCDDADGKAGIPIGRPIANTTAYVLDSATRPVPVGVTGELFIGGIQLARGYFGQPGLTAERFVPDPFGGAGGRLYRTGDQARYRSDGNIDFLGRNDHQVKIRGYRIELGEIEAALRSHDEVHDAVAMLCEDEPGERRLVAYVVSEPHREPAPWVLREHVTEKLPTYMVPSTFVLLEAIPLMASGKVDRRALPRPGGDRQVEQEYTAPRTEVEAQLAAIWGEVLGVDQVGIHDNFFGLGGHSLRAMQVMSRICALFELDVPLRQLLEQPTVAEFATEIEHIAWLGGTMECTVQETNVDEGTI